MSHREIMHWEEKLTGHLNDLDALLDYDRDKSARVSRVDIDLFDEIASEDSSRACDDE